MAEWLRLKALACNSGGCWIEPSKVPAFLHIENAYRICKSLDFDSTRFDTVDSIEISMYRPNLRQDALRTSTEFQIFIIMKIMTIMANYVAAEPYILGNLTALHFKKLGVLQKTGEKDVISFGRNIL